MKIATPSQNLWIPLAIGFLFYATILPFSIIDPTNTKWITRGDLLTQHLGWEFFRNSPWTLPIGLNPNYGLEISSSIVYSGSIPGAAVFFKLMNPFLPQNFQYFGMWLFISCIFQALAGWMLIGLITQSNILRALCTTIICFSPPLLFRIDYHNDLVNHSIIIISIYLCLRDSNRYRLLYWILLIIISSATHIYFLFMVFLLWIGNLFDTKSNKLIDNNNLVLEIFLVFLCITILFWQLGYFSIQTSNAAAIGFGYYKMNILSLFNPDGWSYLFKQLYKSKNPYEYEGFNYLGSGVIFLIPFALFKIKSTKFILTNVIKYKYFLLSLVILFLYSITNNIGIGPINITLPIPEKLTSIASSFRSSGRLFWPVFYVIILLIFFLILRGYSQSKSILLLSACLFIQIIDTSSGWSIKKSSINEPLSISLNEKLVDPFWKSYVGDYKKIIRLPIRFPSQMYVDQWDMWANLANQNHLSTNSVHLARYDSAKLKDSKAKFNHMIKTGIYDDEALFIIDDDLVIPILQSINMKEDLFARIDEFNILAPKWLTRNKNDKTFDSRLIKHNVPAYVIGEEIYFSSGEQKGVSFLLDIGVQDQRDTGWSYPEAWGTWLSGASGKITLPIPLDNKKPTQILININNPLPRSIGKQKLNLFVNGSQSLIPLDEGRNIIRHSITQEDIDSGYAMIQIEPRYRFIPINSGLGDDYRNLSIGLVSIKFQ